MKNIKGVIQAVSRYGGIKIGNKWYNPANDVGKQTILGDKDLKKGEEIVLYLDEKNKVVGYDLKQKEEEPGEESPDIGEFIDKLPPTNQEMVVRENALRHATSLTTTIYSALSEEKQEKIDVDDLTESTLKTAKKIEEWIERGKDD